MIVRSAIQQIALEHRRRYRYRRVTAELRRRGMMVNHKRVARILREDNLLAIQQRRFVLTTDSEHELEVYLEPEATPRRNETSWLRYNPQAWRTKSELSPHN